MHPTKAKMLASIDASSASADQPLKLPAMWTVFGSLSSLVSVGADETVTFSLDPSTSGLPRLLSKGAEVVYERICVVERVIS